MMNTVESHPNIQEEFVLYCLSGQHSVVEGPGNCCHPWWEGWRMTLALSGPRPRVGLPLSACGA